MTEGLESNFPGRNVSIHRNPTKVHAYLRLDLHLSMSMSPYPAPICTHDTSLCSLPSEFPRRALSAFTWGYRIFDANPRRLAAAGLYFPPQLLRRSHYLYAKSHATPRISRFALIRLVFGSRIHRVARHQCCARGFDTTPECWIHKIMEL